MAPRRFRSWPGRISRPLPARQGRASAIPYPHRAVNLLSNPAAASITTTIAERSGKSATRSFPGGQGLHGSWVRPQGVGRQYAQRTSTWPSSYSAGCAGLITISPLRVREILHDAQRAGHRDSVQKSLQTVFRRIRISLPPRRTLAKAERYLEAALKVLWTSEIQRPSQHSQEKAKT